MFLQNNGLDSQKLNLALGFIESNRFAAAFRILSGLNTDDNAEATFALGVCLDKASEYPLAAGCFEKTLAVLKRNRPLASSAPKTDVYRILRQAEIAEKAYLVPFYPEDAADFFETVKENVTIALAEAYVKCGDTDKAKVLINSLAGSEFDEIKTKINAE